MCSSPTTVPPVIREKQATMTNEPSVVPSFRRNSSREDRPRFLNFFLFA
jgi:hypothetical protein